MGGLKVYGLRTGVVRASVCSDALQDTGIFREVGKGRNPDGLFAYLTARPMLPARSGRMDALWFSYTEQRDLADWNVCRSDLGRDAVFGVLVYIR